jgi:hypothetical protein
LARVAAGAPVLNPGQANEHEAGLAEQLRKLGVAVGEFIPSIRSVE